jgi:cytochrome c-type biogenesis protein CcmH
MHIRRPKDAIEAYKHAVSLAPDNAESLSALAEATIQSGSGQILGATVADLKKVVAIDPSDARARFYLALYKDQQGNHRGAIADWITLLKSAPAGAGWAPEVRRVVEQVAKEQKLDVSGQLPPAPAVEASQTEMAPGPNAAQIAAASQMSGSDRDSMIHSMVDQLAKELHQNPHDAGGWVRLIRARMVLGQKAEADAAYHSARDAFSDDPSQLATIDQTARSLGVADR